MEIEAELAIARAKASEDSALIAQQKLRIAKLERQIYGQRSERSSRLIDQLALTFEELEAVATEDELAAEQAVARGWAGPSLLAMIMFEKFGQHQSLNRQADRYALEGVPIALSTMADSVGSVCTALDPLLRLVEAYVMAAERIHADDTTVSVLAKGKTDTGRCWIYVRDDRPFGGTGPPAAMFYYSRDRKGEHPQAHLARYAGILQADAHDGYNQLYLAGRHPGPIREAACWAPVLRHDRY